MRTLMQLYIMRHGDAEGFLTPDSGGDKQRALTSLGKSEATTMAKWFDDMKIEPKHAFVSPYLRAQQTCELITQNMNVEVTTLNFISPLDQAKPVHDFIDGWVSDYLEASQQSNLTEESLVFVTHMPLVSFLIAELTQSENSPIFSTGAVAHVDYDIDKMQGKLVRLISPQELS